MGLCKCGNIVYFTPSKDVRSVTIGITIDEFDDKYTILECSDYTNTFCKVLKDNIRPISDKEAIIEEIKQYYDKEIDVLKSKIKSVTRTDYEDKIVEKYDKLKTEIKNTAKNMLEAEDDTDFEERLKAICQKKRQIFEIKCDEIVKARKINGSIKYDIRKLEKEKIRLIDTLDKKINKLEKLLSE